MARTFPLQLTEVDADNLRTILDSVAWGDRNSAFRMEAARLFEMVGKARIAGATSPTDTAESA